MAEHTTTTDERAAPRSRRMSPGARRVWLIAHVGVSVGWFGGGYAMLVMGVAAMTSAGAPLRPAAYELMHLGDLAIMIPGSLGALGTGLVLGLCTNWHVLHHWWVVVKLVLTVGAMIYAARYVSQDVKAALQISLTDPHADIDRLAASINGGSIAILTVLLAATALSVVKPWGRTRWGRRALARRPRASGRS